MAIGSKELKPVDLDTFDNERLIEELRRAKEELFNLRFQSATGQLESHGRVRAVKRDIARIYTVLPRARARHPRHAGSWSQGCTQGEGRTEEGC